MLTALFVAALSLYRYPNTHAWALPTALALFVIAAVTDALDGYLARRWNAVSVFGRVVDPAADKVLVLGALILLASPAFATPNGGPVAGYAPWMVVVMLSRELMVTSVRAVLESAGVSFAANRSGKLKMILQSAAVPGAMLVVWLAPSAALAPGGWARWTLDLAAWTVTLVTALSSLPYAVHLFGHMASTTDAGEIKP